MTKTRGHAAGAGDERQRQRVLRFLRRGPARLSRGDGAETALMESSEHGTIAVSVGTLKVMSREGKLALRGDRIMLASRAAAGNARVGEGTGAVGCRRLARETRDAPDGGKEEMLVNHAESPLAQLAQRRNRKGEPFLRQKEFMAGERLRRDFTRGQLMPRMGMDWSGVTASRKGRGSAGGLAELTDAALAARKRVEHALVAIGPELSGVLLDVCCFLKGLERVESERGWPVRSAKVVLKTALAALARHYEPDAPGREPGRGGIVHWGTQDYRPVVNAG